jgi:hypothetical protein
VLKVRERNANDGNAEDKFEYWVSIEVVESSTNLFSGSIIIAIIVICVFAFGYPGCSRRGHDEIGITTPRDCTTLSRLCNVPYEVYY